MTNTVKFELNPFSLVTEYSIARLRSPIPDVLYTPERKAPTARKLEKYAANSPTRNPACGPRGGVLSNFLEYSLERLSLSSQNRTTRASTPFTNTCAARRTLHSSQALCQCLLLQVRFDFGTMNDLGQVQVQHHFHHTLSSSHSLNNEISHDSYNSAYICVRLPTSHKAFVE